MPCSDTCRCDDDNDKALRSRANRATRAACDMRTLIRQLGKEDELTIETRRWIKQHDLEDSRRIKIEEESGIRDKARRSGLDKLTLEERRALGL